MQQYATVTCVLRAKKQHDSHYDITAMYHENG